MEATRAVISKSSKRKMSSPQNVKINDFTEMVVYQTKLPNGLKTSVTKHERRRAK